MIHAANFITQEFVPKSVYSERGENSIYLIDERIIILAQLFRTRYGKITINNWHTGGSYNESGLRVPDTSTGAKYSQHKYGRAIDLKFADFTPEEIYKDVLKNSEMFYEKGLRCMENIAATPSWLHIDVRVTDKVNEILIVNP